MAEPRQRHQIRKRRGGTPRPSVIFAEAWRNVTSGTTKVFIFAFITAVAIGGLAITQSRAVVGFVTDALEFKASGAAIQIMSAPGSIDGAQCDALASTPGVVASGALRKGPDVAFAATPTRNIASMEVTAGFGRLVDLQRGVGPWASGTWLASDLAETLGATSDLTSLPLQNGTQLPIDGVYRVPEDGRNETLSYQVLSPVAPTAAFDHCWTLLWPAPEVASGTLRLPVIPIAGGSEDGPLQVQTSQANTKLGTHFDGPGEFAKLGSQTMSWAALAAGILIGFVAVRIRKLELAGALHAGLSRAALSAQILVETCWWVLLATVPSAVAVYWAAAYGNTADWWPAAFPAARTLAMGAFGAFSGAQIAMLATREAHLFRYFKNR